MIYTRINILPAMVLTMGLAGCNGGDDSAGSNTISPNPLASTTITAQNITFIAEYTDRYVVDLSDKVSVSNGKSFVLQDVNPLTQSAECQPLAIGAQSFTIAADTAKACDYEYKVSVTEVPSAQASSTRNAVSPMSLTGAPTDVAVSRVAVTQSKNADTSGVELRAISAVTLIDTVIEINVKQQLLHQTAFEVPEEYALNSTLSLPYSEGNEATADPQTDTILYSPLGGYQGIERILFSYINETTGDVLLGTLDIAVAERANLGLVVKDNIVYDDVEINDVKEIDITPYVESIDDDDFQLVYVDSFNATTAPLKPQDTDNKVFTFVSSKMGNHYVSFAVADKNGAYAMGLMEVPVFDPNRTAQWNGIFFEGLYFTAPMTTQDAAGSQIEYRETLVDTYYTPPADLALFDFGGAQTYCGLEGRLPTSSELQQLQKRAEGNVQEANNWPISTQYLASDNGTAKTVNPDTGIVSDYLGGNYLVTCIAGGLTVQGPTEDVIANGVDEAQVVFTLLGQDDAPILGPTINFTVQSASNQAALATLNESTDENGQAIASVTNIKAEEVTVCGEVGVQNTCTTVSFVGDPATAMVSETSMETLGWIPGDSAPYPLAAKILDANSNAIKGVEVTAEIISDLNDPESAELINRSAFTDEEGNAVFNMVNDEANNSDQTTTRVTHINTLGGVHFLDHITQWGGWQWVTPLDITIAPYAGHIITSCDSLGDEWRPLTQAEAQEYIDASDAEDIRLTIAETNPIWKALNVWIAADEQNYVTTTITSRSSPGLYTEKSTLRLGIDQGRLVFDADIISMTHDRNSFNWSLGGGSYRRYYSTIITGVNSLPGLDTSGFTPNSEELATPVICAREQ
ncbi:Ig-like domain-containing protein [Vibrio jasicida]|uniref:Ig-like domain-containing protein n=1 Tax=Vibrio jasicida TaxID=766224 RepID=UPI0003A007AF|nr:Ig-like domain-containing protein [Vibrio jasicida]